MLTVILLSLAALILLITLYLSILISIFSAPFVPTSNKVLKEILDKAKLKRGQQFMDLGSGDGRVVRLAARQYGVKGVGVELHPMLVFYSQLLSKLQHLDAKFIRASFFKADISKAEVVFLFLLPKNLRKLETKIKKECRKNTLIISHGFKLDSYKKIGEIKRARFSTYYYKVT